MFPRQLLWKPTSPSPTAFLQPFRQPLPRRVPHRSKSSQAKSRTRIDRVLNRLPNFLHPYTSGLRKAPVTHVVSFLILHEITAVVPLVGLAGLFHWAGWIPDVVAEGSAVSEGLQKFGRYFTRKRWFGFDESDSGNTNVNVMIHGEGLTAEEWVEDVKKEGWNVGERGSKILVEVATAYAITKVLLPARVILSVWATPWFAKNVLGGLTSVFGRGVKHTARTGVTSGGVVGKGVENGSRGKVP